MPDHRLDAFARRLAAGSSRRQVLGAGVATTLGLSAFGPLAVDSLAKKKAKCVALDAKCSSKKKCCKGTTCTSRVCSCPSGKQRCGKSCVSASTCCPGFKKCDNDCIPARNCCPSQPCPQECRECVEGQCQLSPERTACGPRGIKRCAANGECQNVSCATAETCPDLTSPMGRGEACTQKACEDNVCVVGEITDESPLPSEYQQAFDCQVRICSPHFTNGNAIRYDPDDHHPNTDCVTYTCTGEGQPQQEHYIDENSECTVAGVSGRCDGHGTCVP